jgi:4-aminobutyrate aminotransferase-like enzyme
VLDVIDQTGLVDQCGRMGERLRAGIAEIASRLHEEVRVRGQGLMIGVDVPPEVIPGVTAALLAERLREHGVLVGTTGPGGNVVKIRPPLIWETEHVDYFLAAFSSVVAG